MKYINIRDYILKKGIIRCIFYYQSLNQTKKIYILIYYAYT